MNTTKTNLYDIAVEQLGRKAVMAELNPEVLEILFKPANEIVVNLPVKMDNGCIEMFTGMRVQHNNLLGPFMGGLRLHPYLSVDEVKALAIWTTLRNSLLDLPLGGANGGIRLHPNAYTPGEIERIIRRFAYSLGNNIGPDYDILFPDTNTTPQIMAWILDAYLSTRPPHERACSTHTVTGKPIELGGCPEWEKASGLGIVSSIEEWAKEKNFSLHNTSYILQGFGSVGSSAACILQDKGAKLVAVEDSSGPVFNLDGIDPEDLRDYVNNNGKMLGYSKAEPIDHSTFMNTRADIFISAALQHQITAGTAPMLKVMLVVEGADAATDPEGDAILRNKGIDILPALLCNSGRTILGYYEWLQSKRSESLEPDEVLEKLRAKVRDAYQRISHTAKDLNTDLRSAAYFVALSRLEKVYEDRGIFP